LYACVITTSTPKHMLIVDCLTEFFNLKTTKTIKCTKGLLCKVAKTQRDENNGNCSKKVTILR
jgi:hypothetical protein